MKIEGLITIYVPGKSWGGTFWDVGASFYLSSDVKT